MSRVPQPQRAPYPSPQSIGIDMDVPLVPVSQNRVPREVQPPPGVYVPNHYHRTVSGVYGDAQLNDMGFYDPSMDEPRSSRGRPGQSQTNKPLYKAHMKYDGKVARSSKGTAVNIAGCDLSAFTKMGVGADEFLKVHEGVMRHNMEFGGQFESTFDAEVPGDFYNIAGSEVLCCDALHDERRASENYEAKWAELVKSGGSNEVKNLSFVDIPWPVDVGRSVELSDLTVNNIEEFLLAPPRYAIRMSQRKIG
ncbi:hypothetical protein BDQ17DRAFT_1432368 [Cyathus striatus]|nr:hypothetical protein BDQ17DRAFT_1432368 [Cyathus striatus]